MAWRRGNKENGHWLLVGLTQRFRFGAAKTDVGARDVNGIWQSGPSWHALRGTCWSFGWRLIGTYLSISLFGIQRRFCWGSKKFMVQEFGEKGGKRNSKTKQEDRMNMARNKKQIESQASGKT